MAVGQAMKRLAVLAQSLVSQLSQGFLVCLRLLALHKTCGSWLASDGGGSGDEEVGGAGQIAGKPALTRIFGVPEIVGNPQNLWELACQRWRWVRL
jgi:hypothetical protein